MGHCITPDELQIIFGGILCDYFYRDGTEQLSSKKERSSLISPPLPALGNSPSRPERSSRTQATDLSRGPNSTLMLTTAQLEGPQLTTVTRSQDEDRYSRPSGSFSQDLSKTVVRPASGTLQGEQSGILFAAPSLNGSNVESKQISSTASPKRQNCVWLPPRMPVSLALNGSDTAATHEALATGLRSPPPRAPRAATPHKTSNTGTTCQAKCPLTPTKSFFPPHSASPSPQHTNNKSPPFPFTFHKLPRDADSGKENADPSLSLTSPGGEAKEEAAVPPTCPSTAPGLIPESESWGELGLRVMAILPGKSGLAWYVSHTGLLHCDNSLPLVWRHYIALLALCRHEVPWAARLLALEFLKAGGDSKWLTSFSRAPAKLQRVMSLNTLLAHQPWALTAEHVQALCCEGAEDGPSWSYSETMLAALLLSHHHALAAFLLCCPLLLPPPVVPAFPAPLAVTSPKRATSDEEDYPESEEEDDTVGLESFIGLTFNLTNTSGSSSVCSSLSSSPCRASVLTSCPSLSSAASDGAISSTTKGGTGDGPALPLLQQQHPSVTNGVKVARYGSEKSVSSRPASPILPPLTTTTLAAPSLSAAAASKPASGTLQATVRSVSQAPQSPEDGGSHARPPAALFPGLLKDPDVGYRHFPHHLSDENSPCISGNSFRWIDYGFDSTRRLLGEECLASELDDRFTSSSELGHCTSVRGEVLAERRIRGPCHKPVWRQVQWLLGVLHDDYDYRLLRRTMPRNLHNLIRTATCFPRRLSSMPRPELQQHQMIAICAQIMDVRMQCEVMFAVRAITRCYTNRKI